MESRAGFLATLRRTQWFSPAELDAYQTPLLDRLLRHAALQTAYYGDRLAPLFNGGDPAVAPIDHSRWREVPILKRSHVIDHVEALRARDVPPDTGGMTHGHSSGSTGRPVSHWRSGIASLAGNITLDRALDAWGVDMAAPMAFITPDKREISQYPHGGRQRGWNAAAPDGEIFFLNTATPTADQLEWLERIRPAHVMTYPFLMQEIAEIARRKKSSLRFTTFVSEGEMLTAETRTILEETFGCQVIDVYGAREIGPIAFACPEGSGYHVCAETLVCELLDDEGAPVAPGEYGHVVVTSLYNYAMPFVRYDVGDYALKSGSPCACGRGLPKVDGIGGRTRSLFIMPDGTKRRLVPTLFTHVAEHLSYREIQLVQKATDLVEIRYVPRDADVAPDLAALTGIFRREFHPALNITVSSVERIERGPGMKFELLVSNVAA